MNRHLDRSNSVHLPRRHGAIRSISPHRLSDGLQQRGLWNHHDRAEPACRAPRLHARVHRAFSRRRPCLARWSLAESELPRLHCSHVYVRYEPFTHLYLTDFYDVSWQGNRELETPRMPPLWRMSSAVPTFSEVCPSTEFLAILLTSLYSCSHNW